MIPGQSQQFFEAAAAQSGAAAGYEIERSLRFNSADSAYLNRTPSSAGNRKTWTLSFWVKLCGDSGHLISAGNDAFQFELRSDGQYLIANSGCFINTYSTTVFRDYSAWQHFVIEHDATNTYCKIYINGSLQKTITASNADGAFNNNTAHNFSGRSTSLDSFTDFYLADVYFIDGQALDPTDFGEYDDNNIWQPKRFTGSFSSYDQSETWSNGSVTTGSLNTGGGSSIAGCFDGSPAANTGIFTNTGAKIVYTFPSTINYTSKVELFAFRGEGSPGNSYFDLGDVTPSTNYYSQLASPGWITVATGSGSFNAITNQDQQNNGGWAGIKVDGILLVDPSVSVTVNSFHLKFADSSSNQALGYDSAVTQPTLNPRGGMDVITYTGNGTSQTIGGLAFLPDFVWIKRRNSTNNHRIFDTVRGPNRSLSSDLNSTANTSNNQLTGFTPSGFNLGSNNEVNQSSGTYVAWAWKAGGPVSSNTDGTLTSSVSASTDYGFSIVSYTGDGSSSATIGHGLNATPQMVIVKRRDNANVWVIAHTGIGTNNLQFDTSAAYSLPSGSGGGGINLGNSTTISPVQGTSSIVNSNASGGTYIAYCWSEIAGFSKFGTYSGNGSSTGPIVTTGFKPRFLLVKRTDSTASWVIWDTERASNDTLKPNDSSAEESQYQIDALVDGFQIKNTWGSLNNNGGTYIYAAFADRPGNNWDVNNLIAVENGGTADAVDFTSSSTRLSLASSSDFNLDSSNWTIEFFFINRSTASQRFYYFGNNTQNLQTATNGTQLLYFNGSNAFTFGSVKLNKLHHVALVNSGGTVTAYIDGSSVTTFAAGSTADRTLTIGAFSDGQNALNGIISNFRIVNGSSVYSSNFSVPTANLSNIPDTVLLCCQSSSSVTDATVAPGSITATGTPTVTTISIPSTANQDSLIDTPTNYEAESGNNGGNYATLNAVDVNSSLTLSNGNLQFQAPSGTGWKSVRATIGVSSGKWYWEYKAVSNAGTAVFVGISKNSSPVTNHVGQDANSYGLYRLNGNIYHNNSASSYTTGFGLNTIVGVALDLDAGTLVYYYDGVSQGTAVTGLSGEWFPAFSAQSEGNGGVNFGQRRFVYTPPTGFLPLVTTSFTDPTIADGSTAMDTTLYSGNDTQRDITGLGFSPDMVWIKKRSSTGNHSLMDTVRGATKNLVPNDTQSEGTETEYLNAFLSDGFSLGISGVVNDGSSTYVAWAWDGGTSNTSISPGDLNSSVYNQDQTWSSSASGLQINNGTAAGFFNGYIDGTGFLGLSSGNDQQYMTGQSIPITANSVIQIYNNNQGSPSYKINGTSVSHTAVAIGSDYVSTLSIPSGATQLQSVSISTSGNSAQYGIKVDGKILVDSTATPPNVPTIASTVRANASAGFSIVSWSGSGSNATIGHGLNAAPYFIIAKCRNAGSTTWLSYHNSLGSTKYIELNSTNAEATASNVWNDTDPTSSVFSVGTSSGINQSGRTYIAYCFAPVAGYSAFGSYTGNGSTDGPFVYTGFRPRWLLIKSVTNTSSWRLLDTARDPENVANAGLFPDDIEPETVSTNYNLDILSNGFKIRNSFSAFNTSGNSYLYMAFAEHPFKTARAR